MSDKKTLLSVKDLKVQFRVRGRILTAIRGISLDIYEDECIAIVGESGSGKSVFTKTFAGMLDSNGFVSQGSIIFNDEELTEMAVPVDANGKAEIESIAQKLDQAASQQYGADIWKQILDLESEKRTHGSFSGEEAAKLEKELKDLTFARVNLFNKRQTFDPKKEKDLIKSSKAELAAMDKQIKEMQKALKASEAKAKKAFAEDKEYQNSYNSRMAELKTAHEQACSKAATPEMKALNQVIAREIYMAVSPYPARKSKKMVENLVKDLSEAMKLGVDLQDDAERSKVFEETIFHVLYKGEEGDKLLGHRVLNLAKVTVPEDWTEIRGCKIATVFQDPMTSLNPILTIGKQITSIIMKHQHLTEAEARMRALEIMGKVGIPHPEDRFDDYPFQYSGGMRQRIVIAIALSCQPRILICDEPTTALDVTIQAQILQLIKDLQKEFHYTTVFITHDLGVVANVADRVAVLYAGQVIEYGNVEEVFYDPRHPYTWALLSSLPQLAERNTTLYSITGTPPSLYNEIEGDAFAPRNPYCMKIDTIAEPPMFPVTESHFAKTWLLHPDAPKMEKPSIIKDIHGRIKETFNIETGE